jgi:hypothetical protein
MFTMATGLPVEKIDTNNLLSEILRFFREASTFSILAFSLVLIICMLIYANIKKKQKEDRSELGKVIQEHKDSVVEYNRSLNSLSLVLSSNIAIVEKRDDKFESQMVGLQKDLQNILHLINDVNTSIVEIKYKVNINPDSYTAEKWKGGASSDDK